MNPDLKPELLRHLVATIVFRGNVAMREAPDGFENFAMTGDVRTPGEILAHLGDLLEGSAFLLKGEMKMLRSETLPWAEGVARFMNAARELDSLLASDAEPAVPVEKLVQGPIADALTHIGQIAMLRRAAGAPVRGEPYFMAEIAAGNF